jgi:glutaredoxin
MDKVTIYTGPGCGLCKMTKKQLDLLGVPYEEIVMNADLATELNIMTVPTLEFNGNRLSSYAPNSKLKEFLGLQ